MVSGCGAGQVDSADLWRAAGAVEALGPVVDPHVLDTHLAPGTRRMNELAVADIDADVGERSADGVEEHQIARLEFILADTEQSRCTCLLVGAPWQYQADAVLEDVAREA